MRFYGIIPNTFDGTVKLARKLSEDGAKLSFVYEAGPCGYTVHRKLLDAGYECRVVAPSLIPRRRGIGSKPTGETPRHWPDSIGPES